MRRDEDDRDGNCRFFQLVLKIQATDTGKSHVQNQAARAVPAPATQKILRRGEILTMQANGLPGDPE